MPIYICREYEWMIFFSSKNICRVCDNIQISFYLAVSTVHFMLNVHVDLDLLTL